MSIFCKPLQTIRFLSNIQRPYGHGQNTKIFEQKFIENIIWAPIFCDKDTNDKIMKWKKNNIKKVEVSFTLDINDISATLETPRQPKIYECCGDGCKHCVWSEYFKQVQDLKMKKIVLELSQLIHSKKECLIKVKN